MADTTQVVMVDVAFTGVPIRRSHGTVVPVAEEEESSVQKDVENPEVEALFVEANFL